MKYCLGFGFLHDPQEISLWWFFGFKYHLGVQRNEKASYIYHISRDMERDLKW